MNRVVVGLFLFLGASLAQTPPEQADLSRFAVASIRPSSPDELGGPSGMQTGHAGAFSTAVDHGHRRRGSHCPRTHTHARPI